MNYPELPPSAHALEEEILERWGAEDLFRKTLDQTRDGDSFVFYEGPPTANGRPGLHHIISRTIKDLVCRHRTMQGRQVTRIAGWDTHGLPVEIEAEKKLGISGKPEIEAVGIARFNEVCRESVFTYKEEWERLSDRIGYWLDYSSPYVTFHSEYIESVWWVLKQLAGKGLLYRGHKSVPYCPRCGTTLSSHEVAQGYQEVEDPSLYFLCPLLSASGDLDSEGRAFLAWTTTPWTVPSNVALAVHEDLEYVEVEWKGRRLILAESRVEALFGEGTPVVARYSGSELTGARYARSLDLVPAPAGEATARAWQVVGEEFVSADDGTGIVHLAPAFGADDYEAGRKHGLPLLNPVDDEGRFRSGVPEVGGMFVKDADPVLVERLREVGNLFRVERVTHSYPHCWRCSSPLLYMARASWFAATSGQKERMLQNNEQVAWHPPDVGVGRFGEWLANNVDWALSRDRFWGTPIPVWICDEDPETVEWVGSLAELEEKAGGLPEGFDPHRPHIDEVTWPCATCSGTMRRAPEVVDVWFDSGAMPYAQWHYPFENEEEFERHFPADFICEGLDQTRGWFYSLMAISTLLDRGPAYRNVIVNGLILDAEGLKMSKSRGNTVDPWDAIEEFGSDALRWYLITSSNPWVPKRYDPEGVRESARKLFDTVQNTYRFFTLYANVEDWRPTDEAPSPSERSTVDRWILSRFTGVVEEVGRELEAYQITRAYRLVVDFMNEDLSNWYIRRSRPRFWGNSDTDDARAAFRTLWEILRDSARLLAPVAPFFADWLHRALSDETVHLAAFPQPEVTLRDLGLEEEMEAARALTTLGRAAREEVGIRVRQPLRTLHAVVPEGIELRPAILDVVRDELNVKEVRFLDSADALVRLVARPNFRTLGPRFQKRSEEAASAIRALPEKELRRFEEEGRVTIRIGEEEHVLEPDALEVMEEAAGDLAVRSDGEFTAAVDPTLDRDLIEEGVARELVNRIQRFRKDRGLAITDRVRIGIFGPEEVSEAVERFGDFIAAETLAVDVSRGPEGDSDGYEAIQQVEIDGRRVRLSLSRAEESVT